MRRNLSIRAGSILLLLLAVSPPLAAAEAIVDQITIKDGSILKGEIKRVENDELILDTDYADDVVIDVEHIVKIKSKQQFSIRLLSGEIVSGFLSASKGKIVLRESLPTPGESKAAEEPGESDFKEPEGEAPPTTPAPEVGEIVQKTSPTAEDQLQPTTSDELPRDEATLEVAKPADGGPTESPTAAEIAKPADGEPTESPIAAEIAKPADGEPIESPTAVERAGGRKFSFDDIDWIREKPTYFRYDAELNVGVQEASGNTDTTDLHFDARFEPSFGWNTLRFSGLYDKKVADGDTTTNRWKASAVYERDFLRHWYVGAANTYESDSQRDLDLRFIVAAGVGYRFYDNDPTHFSVLPALAYVNENFEEFVDPVTGVKSSDDADYVALQLGMDFTRDLYKDDITLFHNNMYLNSLQSLSDIIFETRTGIKFDMAWDLVLTAEVETDWENEPSEDAKKLDTRYMLKIGFEFEGDEDDWFH
jgi:putative salt-induced outer membrane protein YdiY